MAEGGLLTPSERLAGACSAYRFVKVSFCTSSTSPTSYVAPVASITFNASLSIVSNGRNIAYGLIYLLDALPTVATKESMSQLSAITGWRDIASRSCYCCRRTCCPRRLVHRRSPQLEAGPTGQTAQVVLDGQRQQAAENHKDERCHKASTKACDNGVADVGVEKT